MTHDPGKKLRELFAETLGNGPPPEELQRQRAEVLERFDRRRGWRRVVAWRWMGAGALVTTGCAVAALIWWLVPGDIVSPPQAPSLRAWGETGRGSDTELREGSWLSAKTSAALPIAFSEGSRVVLASGSAARLVSMRADQVHLALESGSLRSSIRRSQERRWLFSAGPYRIRVLGTVLSVDWRAEGRKLTVQVDRGRVRVSGGAATGDGMVVVAGQRLDAEFAQARVAWTSRADDASAASGADAAGGPLDAPADSRQQALLDAATPASNKARKARMLWRQLARDERYAEAVVEARKVGVRWLRSTLSAEDLLLLADAARLSGDRLVAKRSLAALRRRFPGTSSAARAAYLLALAALEASDPTTAVRWLNALLQQAPNHRLAPNARGRLMQTLLRLGQRQRAQDIARDYMRLHPDGSYGGAARALLANPSSAR